MTDQEKRIKKLLKDQFLSIKAPREVLKMKLPYKIESLSFRRSYESLDFGNLLDAFYCLVQPLLIEEWLKVKGNYVVDLENLESRFSSEHVPFFYCDIELTDTELSFVKLRFFTHLTIDEFTPKIEAYLAELNLDEIFRNKGIEFNP
jgi:hypothetical protein